MAENVSFTKNIANNDGGVFYLAFDAGEDTIMIFINCSFIENSVLTGSGGVFYNSLAL